MNALSFASDSSSARRILRTTQIGNFLDGALVTGDARLTVDHDDIDTEPAVWLWFQDNFKQRGLSIYVSVSPGPRQLSVLRGSARVATVTWREKEVG